MHKLCLDNEIKTLAPICIKFWWSEKYISLYLLVRIIRKSTNYFQFVDIRLLKLRLIYFVLTKKNHIEQTISQAVFSKIVSFVYIGIYGMWWLETNNGSYFKDKQGIKVNNKKIIGY